MQDQKRDDVLRFVRGGFWRSFMVRYPEVNTMHKKMLRVSRKVEAVEDPALKSRAQDNLWAGQCNCPYWHGVFGGIYLPHIRTANYERLLATEPPPMPSPMGTPIGSRWRRPTFPSAVGVSFWFHRQR